MSRIRISILKKMMIKHNFLKGVWLCLFSIYWVTNWESPLSWFDTKFKKEL